ncbi:MAG: hypothetical protein IJA32_13510 [Lachnospiraceae bacterium]|nr:hypothetical protein [Lachnospiraceae bacterium]
MKYKFSGNNKNELYILMCSNNENQVKKICCIIKCGKRDIIITPGYTKTYLKDIYCRFQCKNKGSCRKQWSESCFVDIDEDFLYGQIHTTRHYNRLHRTLYYNGAVVSKDNPLNSYCEYDRENIDSIVDYELISAITFSTEIMKRSISKNFEKKNKYTIELIASENSYYDVYIFLNPKNNKNLYGCLEECDIDFAVMECENYEIVVGVHKKEGKILASITDFTQMYISTHSNEGVGDFRLLKK